MLMSKVVNYAFSSPYVKSKHSYSYEVILKYVNAG